MMVDSQAGVTRIGIDGPSCAGKSTVAENLRKRVSFPLDPFFPGKCTQAARMAFPTGRSMNR